MGSKRTGFSLIEILVAICVVTIVATIVTPVYMSLQGDAQAAVANQIQSQLNATYANWKDAGGTITGTVYGSMVLAELTSIGGVPTAISNPSDPSSVISDNNSSAQNIRLGSLPPGSPAVLDPNAGGPAPTNAIASSDYVTVYNPGGAGSQDGFAVVPLATTCWTSPGAPTTQTMTWQTAGSPMSHTIMGSPRCVYNGILLGMMTGNSGTLVYYDPASSICYRADYTAITTLSGSYLKKQSLPHYARRAGYSEYHMIGAVQAPGGGGSSGSQQVYTTITWTIHFYTYNVKK